ncbi:MAG: hypothetical protein OEM63_08035 [Gammaproteobacteria bacterium]|nr:hypothetical protein [Gammaproteobacteria bacterium]
MLRVFWAAALLAAASPSFSDPHTDYLLYCRGCHLHTGEAVPDANIPSLHELAPLLATQEGRDYLIRVPGVSQSGMNDERLAAVLNWVLTAFNKDTVGDGFRRFTAEEVRRVRDKILVDPLKAREEILAVQ